MLALFVLAFFPPRWLGVSGWMALPVQFAIQPAQQKLGSAVNWVRGRDKLPSGVTPGMAEMEKQRDLLAFQLRQAEEQIKELRRVISEISHSVEINPGQAIKLITAQVIGGPADLSSKALTVKAGRAQRVEVGSVAVQHAVHLVGRVASVTERTCTVVPITDRSQRGGDQQMFLDCVIMIDMERRGPMCQLKPIEHGKLQGLVMADPALRDPTTGATPAIAVGMTVRLKDGKWAPSAQMLIVGKITAIEPLPNQPLRQQVTVEPEYPPERATEVMIRQLVVEDAPNTQGGKP